MRGVAEVMFVDLRIFSDEAGIIFEKSWTVIQTPLGLGIASKHKVIEV